MPPDGGSLYSGGYWYRVFWACEGDTGFTDVKNGDSIKFNRDFISVPNGVAFTVKGVTLMTNGRGEKVPVKSVTNNGRYSVVIYLASH